jgi:glycosyltransferase involved in cell wall biosynthesis
VNEQLPEEIWRGPGFEFYRDRMRQGRVEEICNPWCPILQGNYAEKSDWTGLEAPQSSVQKINKSALLPEYLRVVPTTACNLKCPMCYQAGELPTRLPDALFAQLEPWIKSAKELLVMGGETFLARQCLQWIRLIDPQRYPSCGLAAITNGLGFSEDVCHLISIRNWNWILISIDAASVPVFSKVRGGNFNEVLDGLDKITRVRATLTRPFELRLGFTLQNSNLCDALSFVDLCDRYNAMPQFTMVFGDWHDESPRSARQAQRFFSILEKVDKKLWERGFGNEIVASALAALNARRGVKHCASRSIVFLSKLLWGHEGDSGPAGFRDKKNHTRNQLGEYPVVFSPLPTSKSKLTDGDQRRHREFDPSRENFSPDFLFKLSKELLDTYSIRIPFFSRHGEPISVLKVYPAVRKLKKLAAAKGWCLQEVLDFADLGLHSGDCSLEYETILEKGEKRFSTLSVVSPIHNREVELPDFVNSVLSQEIEEPFELILVDDRSTDESIRVVVQELRQCPKHIHVRALRTKRKNRYVKGTFSFGAGLAREIAVRQCGGKRILFLDPDQIVEPGCLKEHIVWGNRGFDVVIGERTETGGDVSSQWQCLRTEALTALSDWWLSFFTGNASVDRDVLLRAGSFDPRLQYWGLDDTDLGYRLWKAGASVWHTRRARVLHVDSAGSGGGTTAQDRSDSYRFHMEVLYRKYLEEEILSAFSFVWANRVRPKPKSI